LLAGLFAVVGDDPPVIWARVLGAGLGTLTVGMVIVLAWQIFSEQTAFIAGSMTALYPGAIGMSVFVLSEAPFCPCMLLQLVGWVAAWRSPSTNAAIGYALLAGIAAGAATLIRPSWLLFTPFALSIAFTCFAQRRKQMLIGVAMVTGLVLAMAPWWVRNYGVTGKLTLTTLQTGASLYDGLNPQATGASNMDYVPEFYNAQRREDATKSTPPQDTFEERLDRRMHDAAVAWARAHPGRVMQLAAIKFIRMWSPWPNAAELQSWSMRLSVLLGCTPLVIMGMVGAVWFARRDWTYALCFIPAVYFTCLHVIFVSSIRYRQPAVLALIVLAAGVVEELWQRRRAHPS
jgi:4-amino-4-deoxy-L-arabinose transferase-like glycosyltransferase